MCVCDSCCVVNAHNQPELYQVHCLLLLCLRWCRSGYLSCHVLGAGGARASRTTRPT